ncbi:Phosphatidylglycerophosphatase A [Arcticibacter svalbardensis MN12-7]|uniref:Phosphatidylglycerophosphatase A n=1 Tax=Arcticibacter svalbardensis MN12-7 TaxID=1150600 RepID=R9GVA0_9SPHI|nr:phosphatidylglycerophosphatase A [Arcticibacter svalbardensis]EOR92864.1 Phosphatidylglycerophosphatase A [Arcticibacter svalbardensis MN12-7]
MYKLISTSLGIGYIKGGGTIASLLCCICLYYSRTCGISPSLSVLIALIIFAVGWYTAEKMEPLWGKDNYRIVIDEIAGMYVTMLFVPLSFKTLVVGFLLFRLFDITKPFYIRRLEKLPGGLGVMMDDVLAGIYANLILQIALFVSFL